MWESLSNWKRVKWKMMVPGVSDSRKTDDLKPNNWSFIKWKVRRKSLRSPKICFGGLLN